MDIKNCVSARAECDCHIFAVTRVEGLSNRQHQILEMVMSGSPSKNIAWDLGISRRTVENHRAAIMKRLGARSLPELALVTLAAAAHGAARLSFARGLGSTLGGSNV